MWYGRGELQRKLDSVFTRLVQKPGFRICLVYGDFGAGKTHGIRHMLNKYRESAKLLTSELEYDVSIRTFLQLYQSLVNRMPFSSARILFSVSSIFFRIAFSATAEPFFVVMN